jgi:small GTP-binding protein
VIEEQTYRYIFKLVLIGSGGVGKTCIARRLCFNTFNLNTKLTVGIDFYTHDIPIVINGDKSFVRLSIWDFGGQEHFRSLFKYYINGANGIFVVFDLLQMQSLIRLDWWYDKLTEFNMADRPKMVVGTKLDLVEQDKQYRIDELVIKEFLRKHDEQGLIKTSSKDDFNIQTMFKEMVKKILDFHEIDKVEVP